MNTIELPEIERNPALWLSVLADNELSTGQRQNLFDYCEAHPELWRDCAIALLDSQFLNGQQSPTVEPVRQVATANAIPVEQESRSRPVRCGAVRSSIQWVSVAAMFLMVFATGWWISGRTANQRYEGRLSDLTIQSSEMISSLASLLELNRDLGPRFMSLADVYNDCPMLMELQDSPERSLYVTDRDIPRSLLDAFVAAGHEIELKPYHPRFVPPGMMPVENSLIAIEITKSVRLKP